MKRQQKGRLYRNSQWAIYLLVALFTYVPLPLLASEPPQLELSPNSGTLSTIFDLSVISRSSEQTSRPQLEMSNDFTVSYAGQSSQIQIVNGRASSEIRHLFRLTPNKIGDLKTPRGVVYVGKQQHEILPLSVRVRKEPQEKTAREGAETRDITLSRELSKSSVYIGQQLNSTLTLDSVFNVRQGSFDDLTYDRFWKEDLPRTAPQILERNGRRRFVHQIQHALFPLRAGELTIPPATLQLQIERPRSSSNRFPFFDSGFFQMSRIEEASVTSGATPVRVLPLPPLPSDMEEVASHAHIPVGDLSVSLGLNTDPITVGESKTITVTVESDGNIRPIDELQLQIPSSISAYPDTPKDSNEMSGGTVRMTRTFRISLVPKKEGAFEIPGVALRFFNPRTEQYAWARTRDIRLTVYENKDLNIERDAPPSKEKEMDPKESERSQERVVYRFEEESFLERLSRSISLSLALFSASMVILLIAGVWFLYRLRRPAIERDTVLFPTHIRHPLQLREDFIRSLSSALGAPAGDSYRGYQLEREIEAALQDQELRTLLLRHLERLDVASYGTDRADDRGQELRALSEQSQQLLEQVAQRSTKR